MIYNIVKANSIEDLIVRVNDDLSKGWEPHGNLQIIEGNGFMLYLQPVIKRIERINGEIVTDTPTQIFINNAKEK